MLLRVHPCYLQHSLGIVVLPGGLGPLSLTQRKQWRAEGSRGKGQNNHGERPVHARTVTSCPHSIIATLYIGYLLGYQSSLSSLDLLEAYCGSQEKSSMKSRHKCQTESFCTKRQKPIRNPHALTWLCKFGCLKFKKIMTGMNLLCAFWVIPGGGHLPPDNTASWLPGNALGCCLHHVWWGPMGKDVSGVLCNLLSPLDSCSLFNCDGNRMTKKNNNELSSCELTKQLRVDTFNRNESKITQRLRQQQCLSFSFLSFTFIILSLKLIVNTLGEVHKHKYFFMSSPTFPLNTPGRVWQSLLGNKSNCCTLIEPQIISCHVLSRGTSSKTSQHSLVCFPATLWRLSAGLWSAAPPQPLAKHSRRRPADY